jgi:hypothetical protein
VFEDFASLQAAQESARASQTQRELRPLRRQPVHTVMSCAFIVPPMNAVYSLRTQVSTSKITMSCSRTCVYGLSEPTIHIEKNCEPPP